MSSRSGVVVAVDIGASRMKVAYAGPDSVVHLVRFDGETWRPSGVLVEQDGSLVTGRAAARRAVHRPHGYVADRVGRLTAETTVDVGGVVVETADLLAIQLQVAVAAAERVAEAPVALLRVVIAGTWGPRRRAVLRTALQRAGVGDAELVAAPETVEVTRYRSGMLGHRWAISALPGARVQVRSAAFDNAQVAGITVRPDPVDEPLKTDRPGLFAPPGAYTVTVDADVPFAGITATVIVAGGVDPAPVVLAPALSPDIQPKVEQQIRDRIALCGRPQEFRPYPPDWRNFSQTCPFGHDPQSPITQPPVWTVERLPAIMLRVDEHGAVVVKTTSPGIATIRYRWSVDIVEPRQWREDSRTVEFTAGGYVGVADHAPNWVG
ncbi:hypothetical protein ACQEVZ_58800 [Dactylosporangium sp. CA-152071]|uniref:hypothetical protein n=1 Tax=Dactylosporangium sp. CA-152071 TaxID=3239933 RepID=UPI003D90A6EA